MYRARIQKDREPCFCSPQTPPDEREDERCDTREVFSFEAMKQSAAGSGARSWSTDDEASPRLTLNDDFHTMSALESENLHPSHSFNIEDVDLPPLVESLFQLKVRAAPDPPPSSCSFS